jgi:hypothetical protein
MSPSDDGRTYQAQADQHLAALTDGLDQSEAVVALAVMVNRAATRLHNLARGEAATRKGAADWPGWAGLQNAARTLVLHSSTCRDLARRLAPRGPDTSA